jgi:hypothetical protein
MLPPRREWIISVLADISGGATRSTLELETTCSVATLF